MPLELPEIYPLTDISITGMTHAEQVSQLIRGGASFIQLREKRLTPREFYYQAKDALAIARGRGARIVINDRVDIALALGADGVHLGQDDLPVDSARRLLGQKAIIGISTHTVAQASLAVKLPIDYLAIGPIFQTTTKEDTAAVVGLEGIRAVKRLAGRIPVVAIGGLDFQRIRDVLAAGADSVALISALLSGSSDIAGRTQTLLSQLRQS